MSRFYRAVAIDYDGTLTDAERPAAPVLEVLKEIRQSGRRVVLVTGRIVEELRSIFPDVFEHFDAVVAENGAVLCRGDVCRGLSAPVPVELDPPLVEQGIPFRRGQVLLACDAEHEADVADEVRRLGVECRIVRNRGALMVLPPGVTKGTGLGEALADFGISHHSTIAIGDAENDHSLLESCEVGVAVGNAVPLLRSHADVALSEPNGEGVARFLRGPLLRGELRVEPRRWQIELGRTPAGDPVRLPGSQVSVLITGGTGSGKSYAAGLLAERLIGLGYTVCIFDPEGDHVALGRLRSVVTLGGRGMLPDPTELARLFEPPLGSVVVDLSFTAQAERQAYVSGALDALDAHRARTGMPHWIFLDEAHEPLGIGAHECERIAAAERGLCAATWRPEDLCPRMLESFDFLLAVAGDKGIEPAARDAAAVLGGLAPADLASRISGLHTGQGLLLRTDGRQPPQVVDFGARFVEHVRHWHKYAVGRLPVERGFHFRDAGRATGRVARNLSELHRELRRCDASVLAHHAAGGDFSRWIEDVVQDIALAASIRRIEREISGSAIVEDQRDDLLRAVEERYLE